MPTEICALSNNHGLIRLHVLRAIPFAMACLGIVACSGNEVTPVPTVVTVTRIEVTAPIQVVEMGSLVNVTATLTDAYGTRITDRDVKWSSSDTAVARVSAAGVRIAAVTGVRPGTVTISAAAGDIVGKISFSTVPSTRQELTPQQAFIFSEDAGIYAIPNLPGATASYALGISNEGYVVGAAVIAGGEHAFIWRADMVPTDLGKLAGSIGAVATAVNDSTVVVGYAEFAAHLGSSAYDPQPFRWTRAGGMVKLGLPANAISGEATGVNNAGEISGRVAYTQGNSVVNRPVRWSRDGAVELLALPSDADEGDASAINENGDVVGYAADDYYYFAQVRAMLWRRGAPPLVIGGCGAECVVDSHAISGNGKVAGIREDHAFVWSEATGIVDFPNVFGAQYSEARGVNNAGMVAINTIYPAGPRASYATKPGDMYDLGMIPGKPFTTATAINNNGVIVGFAQ